jgi:pimeloyl-ACP methyl ester carboxylesterase
MRFIPGKFKSLAIGLLLISFSCSDDTVLPKRVLVSSQHVLTRTNGELQTFLGAGSLDLDLSVLMHDVEVYKVTYETTFNGQTINASAVVSIPKTSEPIDMVSFQHGTIAAHTQAPSALALSSTELILYTALASPGFISVAPDLIGFGASKDKLHPYYIEEFTASAIVDALKAARDLASDLKRNFSGKLFLAGYSQGGYATMATHKSIETEGLEGFDLIASFPAAGGYDIKNMQEYFFGLQTYEQPFYLAFVAQAYKKTFDWAPPLTDMFREPYASRIPALLDGSKSAGQINEQLTLSMPDLLTAEILANIDTDVKFKYLIDAFNANSLTDWKPTKPMFMYHGDADTTVPYSNSIATYNKLIANGTSTSVVTLTALPGADHGSGVFPYIERFIPKMLSLR